MMKGWFLALVFVFCLSGCAGLTQFPDVTNNYDAALRGLDSDYARTLDRIYGKDPVDQTEAETTSAPGTTTSVFVSPSPEEQKRIRNAMIERRMAVIDAYFKDFQVRFVKENVRSEFAIALFGIGVGGAGSLVSETASQILSAVSAGLAGAQAAYSKAVLYDKAMSALLAQMQAGRKAIAAEIYQRWQLGLDQYPMWMAKRDLDAYYFAGSLPGAIIGTAADAKLKEMRADEILLRPITAESVSDVMFRKREDLKNRITNLAGAKAMKLVNAIENRAQSSKSFKDAKEILDDQYTAELRSKDSKGKTAIMLLKRAIIHSVRSPEEAKEWEALIDTIEKQ